MFMRFISSYEKVINVLNDIAIKISCLLLFLMMILTFGDVTGRFLWRPITGTYELTYLWLALIVFLSLGYTQQKKGHISVGVLVDKLPPRGQAIVDIITYIAMLWILLFMAKQTYVYSLQLSSSVTGDLKLPVSIFVMVSALGILFYAFTVVVDFLKAVVKVVNPNES